MTGSSAAVFLVDTYPDPGPLASETSHQMIRFNPLRFLGAKKCSSICPEKTTENSIQMVSAPGHSIKENRCVTMAHSHVYSLRAERVIHRGVKNGYYW